MTAQVTDTVVHDGFEFAVAGVSGGPLFEPQAVGLKPVMMDTSCWRGFVCVYSTDNGRLHLTSLMVGAQSMLAGEAITEATVLLGAQARPSKIPRHAWLFEGLRHPIDFSGGLLLGRGFIRSTYVHMGFHPAWKYEQVVEVILADGTVTKAEDLSAAMAAKRDAIETGREADPDGEPGGRAWVERTFTLSYDRSIG